MDDTEDLSSTGVLASGEPARERALRARTGGLSAGEPMYRRSLSRQVRRRVTRWSRLVAPFVAISVCAGGAFAQTAARPPRSTPPPPWQVVRCQDEVRRDMASEVGPAEVRFTRGDATAVSPSVTHVQGEAEVQRPGGTARYRYVCTFHPQEGDRLARADFHRISPPGTAPPGGVTPTAVYLPRCQDALRRDLGRQASPANVRFVSGRTTAVDPRVTNVQGEVVVQPRPGVVQRYTYLCTFHPQDGGRLVRSEYRPSGAPRAGGSR